LSLRLALEEARDMQDTKAVPKEQKEERSGAKSEERMDRGNRGGNEGGSICKEKREEGPGKREEAEGEGERDR
jgi:hypothetical protein